ncbi:hypothetical protein NKR23_g389 [Pleurostoma richardsiae]|uniref:Integral membrane protein n=1 Tax=Pleurostoma richardsiae TaxID=41990 RepID=A0AA38S708_9PEZI|nr:hypothetical protein NKR23_g389 [Pleurostoma richardsiae]
METTLVPFSTLPSCATACGHLYDANGACVPPAVATADAATYDACFCSNSYLTPFSTGTAGVCDSACTAAADSGGLSSIQAWYTSFCANVKEVATTTATTTGSSSSSTSTSSSSSSSNSSGGGGSWLDTHWRWVIFIVVVVVAIAGIWIGACIWRRHYLRRKDRQYALGKTLGASTRSGTNPYGHGGAGGGAASNANSQRSVHLPQPGFFNPAPLSSANVFEEKPRKVKEKKKWVVKERT